MIIIVTGGRHYSDQKKLSDVLSWYHKVQPITLLIHGACYLGGADALAEAWAKANLVPYLGVPPAKPLTTHPEEGPKRNAQMAGIAKIVAKMSEKIGTVQEIRCVAFPGGRGTKSMIDVAHEADIKVKEIK